MGFSAQHGLLFVSPEWAQQLIHAVDLHSGSREDLKTQFLQFDPRGEWLIIESQGALELHRVAR